MKKLLAIALVAALAGCATPASSPVIAKQVTDCEAKGDKDIIISFGDSKIEVTNKVSASKKKKDRLVVVLKPEGKTDLGVDYGTLVIHLIGKNNKSSWINMAIAANQGAKEKGKFPICIDNIDTGMYHYQVYIPTVGTIDPRVDIND